MYRNQIQEIKMNLALGLITYEQAKEQAKPIIDEMNEKGKAIANKYNQKFRPFTFTGLMR